MRTAAGSAQQLAIEHLEGFVTALAGAGVVAGLNKRADFLRGVALVRPASPAELYWAARVTLVSAREEIAPFDRVFAAWFGDGLMAMAPPSRRPAPSRLAPSRQGRVLTGAEGGSEGRRKGAGHQASVEETSSTCAFPATSAAKRQLLAEAEAALRRALPTRRARRHRPARRGDRLDLRRVLRAAGRNGGDVVRLPWRRRPRQPRRVLVLVDVSGSLRQTSGDALRFAHALVRAVPRAEVYTFGTRLTRVTRQLAVRDVDTALDGLAGVVLDVNGGTRIGRALEEFLADARRTAAARDALVLIVSDGLERGDPGAMVSAVQRLGRLSHRVVWWSPLACDPGYQPLTRGMAAVVDDLDDLVGVGDLPSAVDAVPRLAAAGAGRRRSASHKVTKSRPEMMTEGPITVAGSPRSWGQDRPEDGPVRDGGRK
ncbi:MAG: VWA domain-containing protein [Acidimicrobiales bacterium]|jgi:uncharacterized protein with von Willebrand factor type A (vWA) domain